MRAQCAHLVDRTSTFLFLDVLGVEQPETSRDLTRPPGLGHCPSTTNDGVPSDGSEVTVRPYGRIAPTRR
ncbi:hypothetical protein [Streptomyces canus]|uniref:hypothetical protein n=1 Tax=Streptomyces canus TaxID=58343 RepID=UPI00324FE444